MIHNIRMVIRKYETEIRASIVVHPLVFGRPRDLRGIPINTVQDCHLYIVSRRPRLSIEPSSVRPGESPDETRFDLRVQVAGNYLEYPGEIRSKLFTKPLDWISEWPYEEFSAKHDGTPVLEGSVGQLPHKMVGFPDELRDLEVLYIGQAFGKDGERNAYDRLKSHSTLQAILEENRPDFDIWLTLCEISDVTILQDMDNDPAQITGEEDVAHILEVLRRADLPSFYGREALTMAEAGLIRYFMPHYNEMFKRNYPDPKHVHISTAYDLDLADLFVELHEYSIRARFWSPKQPVRQGHHHTVRFSLRNTGGLVSLIIPATSQSAPEV